MLLVDMSTVSPATTDLVAAEAAARQIEFLDAPVGGWRLADAKVVIGGWRSEKVSVWSSRLR